MPFIRRTDIHNLQDVGNLETVVTNLENPFCCHGAKEPEKPIYSMNIEIGQSQNLVLK